MTAARVKRDAKAQTLRLDLREEERRRIARELHDGPAQAIAAALFGVDLAVAAVDRRPATAREELLRARELVRDALDDVRGLMSGLRPRLLEERGLVAALGAIAAVTPLWGPRVVVDVSEGLVHRLPADVELGLYRIAQEAVSNARRHGAASLVTVSLAARPGGCELAVSDDGRGFPTTWIGVAEGHGLPGMRERAELLGGTLQVTSRPGEGTRVVVFVPLPEKGADMWEETQ